ncbi:hypothetical protein ACO0LG_12030 [Undibacterium sp. Ji42W]|uniref:hypothetical protein n=1 Tax=Undibacterium sp. Ji42W TaxID=3413039 RepID=UPI003BF39945
MEFESMKQVTKDWIEAVKALSVHPLVKVICPVCKKGTLKMDDIRIPNYGIVESKIWCDKCGACNYLRMPLRHDM